VKTASDIVPMMNAFELLYLSMNGGFEPCCVKDNSQSGRAISPKIPAHPAPELSFYAVILEQGDGSSAIRCRGDENCMMFDASMTMKERSAKRAPGFVFRVEWSREGPRLVVTPLSLADRGRSVIIVVVFEKMEDGGAKNKVRGSDIPLEATLRLCRVTTRKDDVTSSVLDGLT
jgi:hypothetical protein